QKTRNVFVLEKEKIRPKYWVPDCSYSPKARVSWLAGIIDSDGCVNNKNKIGNTIAIASTNLSFLKEVRYMLSTIGCSANITTMHEERDCMMPDGRGGEKEYHCKQVYRMFLTGKTINQLIKFGMETKRVPIAFYKNVQSNSKYVKVVSVTKAGVANKVYCFNEPKRHMGVFANTLIWNCSEFMLYPYESCLIGSINLAKFDPKDSNFFNEIKETARILTICLDNVIDHSWYPDKRIEEAAKKFRRIGVGVTGLADCLFNAELRYGSASGVAFTEEIMKAIQMSTLETSSKLAEQYGTFPEFDRMEWDTRLKLNTPIRNITTTVIAPAGSTSILAGADGSGCEPLFSLAYDRMMRRDKEDWYTVVPSIVQDTFYRFGIELTPENIMDIKDNGGSVQGLDWVPEEIQEFMVTAQDLTPEDHLNMLIGVQKYVGASVSKTVNMPSSATVEDVEKVYLAAYEGGIKGITIFRDGCKSNQVLRTAKKEEPEIIHTKDLPVVMPSIRVKIPTPSGSMYMMTSFHNGKPVEVFCNLGKSGMDDYAYTEAIGRVLSLCLKRGIPAEHIIKTLKGIRGKDVSVFKDSYVYSVPDAIAIALGEALTGFSGGSVEQKREESLSKNLCPDCLTPLVLDNGCFSCYNCGYSSCS
ncbi:MAG: LAGLIDADG family homing endonuclease, partial [Candidatus Neomarinimicrobiota bacterium]